MAMTTRRKTQPAQLSERSLVAGRSGGPGVRIRQAIPGDVDAIRRLARLAGVQLEDELADAIQDETAGAALRAGLRGGPDAFTRHMAGQFIAHRDSSLTAYLSAALVLVAEQRDHGIVGTLVAYPPANVAGMILEQTRRRVTDPHERSQLIAAGGLGLAKVKALAVAGPARGQGIGGAMLAFCAKIYQRCQYVILYGQMPPTPGLEAFYTRYGFQVLPPDAPADFWVVFGIHTSICPGPGERMFIRLIRQS